MQRLGLLVLVTFLPLALAAADLGGQTPRKADVVPPPSPPEQPLPFSHRAHASANLRCLQCHVLPDPGERATLPATATCMACHIQVRRTAPAIQQLRDFSARGEAVPWVPVSRVPSFVIFSHRAHLAVDSVACDDCHGPVRDMDQMRAIRGAWMDDCVSCHEDRGADVGCATCHDPR